MFFDVTVKSTAAASHLHDDLRLFRFFRIGSAPRFTSCPYGTEHFGHGSLEGCDNLDISQTICAPPLF